MTRIRDHGDRSYIPIAARRCCRSSTGHATALPTLSQAVDHTAKCSLADPAEARKNRPLAPSNALRRGGRSLSSTIATPPTGINPHTARAPHHRA